MTTMITKPTTRAQFIQMCKDHNAAVRARHRLWVLIVRTPFGVPINAEERAKQKLGHGFKAGRGAPIGVAVCYRNGPNICFGLSLCNPKEHKFNGHMGLYYALQAPAYISRAVLLAAVGRDGGICDVARAALANRAQVRGQHLSSPRAEVAKTTVVHMLLELCSNSFKQLQTADEIAEGDKIAAEEALDEVLADEILAEVRADEAAEIAAEEAAAEARADETAEYPAGSTQP